MDDFINNIDLLNYSNICNNIKESWNEERIFDEYYLIKALIKGIQQNILKIEIISN